MKRYSVDVVARNKAGRQLWARRCLWEGGAEDAAGALTAARDALRPLVTADADSFALTVRGPGAELVTATEYAEDVVHGDGSSAGGLLDNWQLELTPEQRSAAMAEAERKAAQAAVDLLAKPKVGPFDGLADAHAVDIDPDHPDAAAPYSPGYGTIINAIWEACRRVKAACGFMPKVITMGDEAQRCLYDEQATMHVPQEIADIEVRHSSILAGAIAEHGDTSCVVNPQTDPHAWVVGPAHVNRPGFATGGFVRNIQQNPFLNDALNGKVFGGVVEQEEFEPKIEGSWSGEGPNVDGKEKFLDEEAYKRAVKIMQQSFDRAVRNGRFTSGIVDESDEYVQRVMGPNQLFPNQRSYGKSSVQQALDDAAADAHAVNEQRHGRFLEKVSQQLREEILRGSVSLQSPRAIVKPVVDDVVIDQIREFNLIGGEVFYLNEAGEEVHIGTINNNINHKPGEQP